MKQYKDTPYYITEDGKVYRNGRELKPNITSKGYRMVSIFRQKKYVHRLVSELYIENIENKPQVNHIDCNKLNNHYTNLEWVTNQENRNHAVLNGLHKVGVDCYNNKFTEDDIRYIRSNFISGDREFGCNGLSKKFNTNSSRIWKIVNYKTWKHL